MSSTSTSRALIAQGAAVLAAAGVPSPQVDACLLLEFVTGRARHELLLGRPVEAEQAGRFADLLQRRATREPLQHLTGQAHFRYLTLAVGPGVFIPRPESELLVDDVLRWMAGQERRTPPGPPQAPDGARWRLLDLCSGSGALAVALATEVTGADVIGVEASSDALAWAARNAMAHSAAVTRAGSTLAILAGDATDPGSFQSGGPIPREWLGHVDVVVSNPPYIPDWAVPRDPEVRDHDPGLALFGGPDGLDVIRPLARAAALLLRPGGLLLIEHADSQGEDAGPQGVPSVLREMPDPLRDGDLAWARVADMTDLAGRPRYTRGERA